MDTKQLLSDSPQTLEIGPWENPVVDAALRLPSLRTGSRLGRTDLLFRASDAQNLVCDGNTLTDAGITASRRLWLLYEYASLTNLNGNHGYTTIFAMVTSVVESTTIVHVGFDWLHGDNPSRLTFDSRESKIRKSLLNGKSWRALHSLEHPERGITIR